MDGLAKIPALALLGLSFTACTGRDTPDDPIVGDWRAVQVDGDKHPESSSYAGQNFIRGEQLRIDADHDGEMARYAEGDFNGLDYFSEVVADLVVDASAAPKYRIEVAHDFFEDYGDYGEPDIPSDPGTGYDGTGYADTGAPDTAGYADDEAPHSGRVRPLQVPTSSDFAPAAMVFDCTLEADTLTCDREGADELKHWVFARIEPDGS